MKREKTEHIDIPTEGLVALFQGKEVHLHCPYLNLRLIFHSPHKGIFLTDDELYQIKVGEQNKILNLACKILDLYYQPKEIDNEKKEKG